MADTLGHVIEDPAERSAARSFSGRVGYVVTSVDLESGRWHTLAGLFTALEEAGADAIWLTDHLFSGHPCGDPFVLATVAATATTRCAIGTGVLQLALRRSAAVAKAASTLQLVSGGRFRLGVGVGEHAGEFARAGVDFTTRGRTVDRQVAELMEHWADHDGWFTMRPYADVPIWVGGASRAALTRTARSAVGWVGLFLDPPGLLEANRRLDVELVARGRHATDVERRMIVMTCPTDGEWTRDDALTWAGRQFPGELGGIERHIVTGSVAECTDAIRALTDTGIAGVDLQITHPDPVPRFAALRAALSEAAPGHPTS